MTRSDGPPGDKPNGGGRGRRLADRRVRVARPHSQFFRYAGPGVMTARPEAIAPTQPVGRLVWTLRRAMFGRLLASAEEIDERLSKVKALATFSSDNLSSVAYATEAIMFTLLAAGSGCVLAGDADLAPDRHDLRDHRDLLPPDDPRLPERRRQLHRGQGEPGDGAGAAGRGGPADRLRPDRLGQRRGRHPGDHLGVPGPGRVPGPDGRHRDRRGHAHQPARHPRERDGLRHPDLRVP